MGDTTYTNGDDWGMVVFDIFGVEIDHTKIDGEFHIPWMVYHMTNNAGFFLIFMGWFPSMGVPKDEGFIMENPINMDDSGIPLL